LLVVVLWVQNGGHAVAAPKLYPISEPDSSVTTAKACKTDVIQQEVIVSAKVFGEFRAPRQMLATQEYEGHLSIHDDKTAAKLGFAGAPIEGPTHFSQFVPLLHEQFGDAWFERGCISAHYQNMVVEGEEVRAGPLLRRTRAHLAVVCDLSETTTSLLLFRAHL
jgi:hypothetical protein